MSIDPPPGDRDWRAAGLRYYPVSRFFQATFGRRVHKVSLDARLGCPNVDGTVGRGGCVFCNLASISPARRGPPRPISAQLEDGIRQLGPRFGAEAFVAYFQPGTNTYGPPEQLRDLWQQAIAHPRVVGLAVGTRPDCVPDPVLDLLAELAQTTWVCVEYGLQTVHRQTLQRINRGHDAEVFEDAVCRTGRRGLHVGAHVILGLPGESPEQMWATADRLAQWPVHSVKLHNLLVVRQTRLAQWWRAGQVQLPELDEYVDWVVRFLERLRPDCVVDRLCADAPRQYLLAPRWSRDPGAVRRRVEEELRRRDTWQGRWCRRSG